MNCFHPLKHWDRCFESHSTLLFLVRSFMSSSVSPVKCWKNTSIAPRQLPYKYLSINPQFIVIFPSDVFTRAGVANLIHLEGKLIYRTPSRARYSVSFRRVVNFQDMNTIVRKQSELSYSVRTYAVNCKVL
jgi:hypothetical protein